MKPRFSQLLFTALLLCLPFAAPPSAAAGPLKAISSGLKKLNPFKKETVKPAAEPPSAPKPKPKPTVAKTPKTPKPAPVKKKKTYPTTTTKKKATTTATPAANKTKARESTPGDIVKNPEAPTDANTKPRAEEALPSSDGTTPAADATPAPAPAEIPFGTPVMGRKGHVRSPYAEEQGMVDVTDIPAGAKVKCPFTGKVFRVP